MEGSGLMEKLGRSYGRSIMYSENVQRSRMRRKLGTGAAGNMVDFHGGLGWSHNGMVKHSSIDPFCIDRQFKTSSQLLMDRIWAAGEAFGRVRTYRGCKCEREAPKTQRFPEEQVG